MHENPLSEDTFQIFKIFPLLSLPYRNKKDEIEGKRASQNGASQQATQVLSPWLCPVADRKGFWEALTHKVVKNPTIPIALTLCQ